MQCRAIIWREKKREILASNENGMITVWSAKEGSPLYVLQAHTSAITQMIFLEDKQQIVSCAKDKRVKVWQLPPVWMDEEKVMNVNDQANLTDENEEEEKPKQKAKSRTSQEQVYK